MMLAVEYRDGDDMGDAYLWMVAMESPYKAAVLPIAGRVKVERQERGSTH
jgi:hypothetical protein